MFRVPAFFSAGKHFARVSVVESRSVSSIGFFASTERRLFSTSTISLVKEKKRIPIYTRTGDKGKSSLFNGSRVNKDDAIFEALGATDELTSCIGLARELCIEEAENSKRITDQQRKDLLLIATKLESVQCSIQELQSNVATPRSDPFSCQPTVDDTINKRPEPMDEKTKQRLDTIQKRTSFNSEEPIHILENWIDEFDSHLPPLKNFILPSGGACGAALHMARTICRRAERNCVPLARAEMIDRPVVQYLNRLSDFLYTSARFASQSCGKKETIFHSPLNK